MKFHTIENQLNIEDYQKLRIECGLSKKSKEAAEIGLMHSLYTVAIANHEGVIAMGRLIGDGGTACQVVDICVLPDFQRQGLGKTIMSHIMKYAEQHLPKTCYLSLIADGDARFLYEKYGFKDTMPESIGMYYEIK